MDDYIRDITQHPAYRCSHGNPLGDCDECWQEQQDEQEQEWWEETVSPWWLTLTPTSECPRPCANRRRHFYRAYSR